MTRKFVIPFIVLSIIFTLTACASQVKDTNDGIAIENTDQVSEVRDESADAELPAESTDDDTAADNAQDTFANNGGIVELTGNYTRFDGIRGFGGDYGDYRYLTMIGEADGNIIMAYLPPTYDEEELPSIMLVESDTLNNPITYLLDSPDQNLPEWPVSHVKMAGDKILVCFEKHILVLNNELRRVERIPLPEAIVQKAGRGQTFDENENVITYFGGYDISNDMMKIVYTDEEGIKLYDIKSDKEVLLTKNVNIEDRLKRYIYGSPRFIANDTRIIANKKGYEYSLGYVIYDIADGSLKTVDLLTESGPNNVYYDTGLLEPGVAVYNAETDKYERKRIYLDFESGDVTELQAEKEAYEHYLFQDNAYVGENYAAFVTYVWDDDNDESETKNDTYYINRLNLKTMETENDIMVIKGGGPQILGVLADGRVLFRYTYKDSESGVCIAK